MRECISFAETGFQLASVLEKPSKEPVSVAEAARMEVRGLGVDVVRDEEIMVAIYPKWSATILQCG